MKIEMFYSKEDKGFIVIDADAPSFSAFGRTPRSALYHFSTFISMMDRDWLREKKLTPPLVKIEVRNELEG